MSWSWVDESDPPAPQGVVGTGDVARRLLAAVEQLVGAHEHLSATAHEDLLVLTGAPERLPWVDGVQYIAPRTDAAGLWLPTTQRPTVALDLLERAIQRRHPLSPLLLLREPAQLVPLTRLLPVNAALMRQIRERWHGA